MNFLPFLLCRQPARSGLIGIRLHHRCDRSSNVVENHWSLSVNICQLSLLIVRWYQHMNMYNLKSHINSFDCGLRIYSQFSSLNRNFAPCLIKRSFDKIQLLSSWWININVVDFRTSRLDRSFNSSPTLFPVFHYHTQVSMHWIIMNFKLLVTSEYSRIRPNVPAFW